MSERFDGAPGAAAGPQEQACGRCHMSIARFAPQVFAQSNLFHRECYEAWFFGRHGRRPKLQQGDTSYHFTPDVTEAGSPPKPSRATRGHGEA